MLQRLQYAPAWIIIKLLGVLPRPLARAAGISFAQLIYLLHPRLRHVGMRNLALAFPEKTNSERARILRGVFTSLGRQLAEVCHFPKYTLKSVNQIIVYDGFENYERAHARGKGVLFLTAHFGGWELSAFSHSMHDNTVVDKDDFVRGLLAAMKKGEVVGILMDTNMTPPQGIFVNFFGIPACTASGPARIALRTDAAVVPTFTIWDPALRKYRLRFDPAVELIRTSDNEADIIANTQMFTKIIEDYVRRYPEQWLWVHRRWKTRPEGQPPIY
jgi:KDO2-lipid IV(A) lauroyltransferase